MTRRLWMVGVALALSFGSTAFAQDFLIPGTIAVVKAGKLAKFIAKSTTGFPLPLAGGVADPTINGAEISMFDDSGSGGSFTHPLPAVGWTALGNPPGSKGYKYSGSTAGDPLCKVVLVKEKLIKAVCKGSIPLAPPFSGNEGIVLGTGGAAIRYCAAFGGVTYKNDTSTFIRKYAPAPGACPSSCGTAGRLVGGACWYLSPAGGSCDAACIAVGKTCDAATTTNFAGSGGSDVNCELVVSAFGIGFFLGSFSSTTGTGCGYGAGAAARVASPATTCAAQNPPTDPVSTTRVCACQ